MFLFDVANNNTVIHTDI